MSVQFDVKNLLETLTCPIELEPLTAAVNLSPCNHKVNQVAAERYYGKIIEGLCELNRKNCVVCQTPVSSYAPDHTIRNVVAQVLALKQHAQRQSAPLNPPVFSGVNERQRDVPQKKLENLPHPLQLQSSKINTPTKSAEMQIGKSELLYPGLPAVFTYMFGDWDRPFNYGTNICREVTFASCTPNSLLHQFTLLGYYDGTVAILVKLTDSTLLESFKEYLLAHHCGEEELTWKYNGCATTSHADIKNFFKVIACNNEFPKNQFVKIAEIVNKGSCDPHPGPWIYDSMFSPLHINRTLFL